MSILFEAVSVLQTPPLTNYTSCPSIRVPNLIKYMTHNGISTADYLHSFFILVFLLAIFLCVLFLCIILHFFREHDCWRVKELTRVTSRGF